MLGGPVMNLLIAFVLMAIVLVGIGLPTVTTNLAGVSQCVIPADADADARVHARADQAAPGRRRRHRAGRHRRVLRRHRDHVLGPAVRPDPRARATRPSRSSSSATASAWTSRSRPSSRSVPSIDENDELVLDSDGDPVTEHVGFLGITPAQEMVRQSPLDVVGVVADTTWQTITVVATLPARVVDLVESQVNGTPRDANSIVGVVGIGRFAGEIASTDGIEWQTQGRGPPADARHA